jgi:hypothetical protein
VPESLSISLGRENFFGYREIDGSQKLPQAFGRGCATAPSLFFIAGPSPAMKKIESLRSLRALREIVFIFFPGFRVSNLVAATPR